MHRPPDPGLDRGIRGIKSLEPSKPETGRHLDFYA